MPRKNTTKKVIDYENSFKKSNRFSMARLSHGMTLKQMQLLAYAIYSTQQKKENASFRKYEFQEKFNIEKYQTVQAKKDTKVLYNLGFTTEDLSKDYFDYLRVFQRITYKKGVFEFQWTDDLLPHILDLKEHFILNDLTITSKFKSSFSWILYDYLKANYGYWNKELSKEELMKLFVVEDRKSYRKSTAQFKRGVLDTAIQEINKYTELEVWYTEKKVGNKIVGFKIHWSIGENETGATKEQLTLLREIHDEVENNLIKYISIKNTEDLQEARYNIIKIKEINKQVNDTLTYQRAKELIIEAKILYKRLHDLLIKDGQKRDTSVYFNWLEES